MRAGYWHSLCPRKEKPQTPEKGLIDWQTGRTIAFRLEFIAMVGGYLEVERASARPENLRPGSNTRELSAATYEKLRRLAAEYLRSERAGHTLQPTALVHE